MMQASGPNKQEFYDAWADTVVKMWQGKMLLLDVWDDGTLYDSFINHVIQQSGGDTELVRFVFAKYGIYVDMGVGRDTPVGNPGDLGKKKRRQAKEWYSPVFYREVKKLAEFQAYHYGKTALWTVKDRLSGSFDQRYKRDSTKTIGSLKTEMYRSQQSKRNWRNYNRRRYGANWEEFLKEKGWL